tara:strand:+ start:209 stop:913 length:705 start_codon:yes stop_codon:yes gene_type:complete
MATLTGTQIRNTYDSLLKLEDNDGLSSASKLITDGLGNATPLSISTSQISSSVDVQAASFSIPSGLSTDALMSDGSTLAMPSGKQVLDWTVAQTGLVIHNSNIAGLYSSWKISQDSVLKSSITNGINVDFQKGNGNSVKVVDDQSASNSVFVQFNCDISGSGADNYVPLWNGTDELKKSIIYQDGVNIGMGTLIPTSKLQVVGLSKHSSNAAAQAAGLTAGAFYHDQGNLRVVY